MHKVVQAMEFKVDLQCNEIFHLEDSVVLYGIYNSDTLENLIDTVHRLHNQSTLNEKLFVGEIEKWQRENNNSKHSFIDNYIMDFFYL